MSNVASRIYAILSEIRQQMSAFDPFRGGGAPKADNVCFFYRFFNTRASLSPNGGSTNPIGVSPNGDSPIGGSQIGGSPSPYGASPIRGSPIGGSPIRLGLVQMGVDQ